MVTDRKCDSTDIVNRGLGAGGELQITPRSKELLSNTRHSLEKGIAVA